MAQGTPTQAGVLASRTRRKVFSGAKFGSAISFRVVCCFPDSGRTMRRNEKSGKGINKTQGRKTQGQRNDTESELSTSGDNYLLDTFNSYDR